MRGVCSVISDEEFAQVVRRGCCWSSRTGFWLHRLLNLSGYFAGMTGLHSRRF